VTVPPGGLEERLDQLRHEVEQILEQTASWPNAKARGALVRLLERINVLAKDANQLVHAIQSEEAQLDEVLDVLFALARLDFTRRAPVSGTRPLDALAQVANMLSEELEAAEKEMADAKAKAISATAAKSRFLAHMSHEIRTPLTALIGFADLLSAPTLTESERLNYAMIIRRNGEHLLSVINDILDLSRIEAGQLTVETIECSPVRILSEVASLMRVRAEESGLAFSVELVTPVPATIKSDPTRLRQILLNLVGNAVKFTRKGRIAMDIRFDRDPDRVVFGVVDSGIGMSPEEVAELFQPFHQADPSMSRRFGGSGLGLAISRALAEAVGGTVSVESTEGQGSSFRLTIPVGPLESDAMVTRLEELSEVVQRDATQQRFVGSVLVVEDGVDNQILFGTILRSYGLTVEVASDGRTAVHRALEAARQSSAFDVILMDMQMPVMDGYAATETLRKEGYRGPILALTAHAMEGERERCLEAGCNDYIRKPIERGALATVLAGYLRPATAAPPLYSTFADDPVMAGVVAKFIAALPKRIAALRAEARAPGSEQLARLVHQLKGAAGSYGFAPITDAALAVERVLQAGADHAHVLAAIESLAEMCARVRAGAA
jgi:signal transduction histidine kinase/DNA-binding response OmpR family regulator